MIFDSERKIKRERKREEIEMQYIGRNEMGH